MVAASRSWDMNVDLGEWHINSEQFLGRVVIGGDTTPALFPNAPRMSSLRNQFSPDFQSFILQPLNRFNVLITLLLHHVP